ncbi:type VI secretion system-associated protein TagO [Enterovibrio nigricans]|uniref:Type VI secretion system protein VasI n=1 Tax=Enterovibrio nigricans DSM 22720 TaxID=1121868 RepID=A0A1T4UQY8_9GAMM|nr:type VI secretion system-associated protein TagO [Enterovibrio nigricans]SKA55056.1 type VI secretion system protein VasI [Enterovibrio nigricans DSM 22720]
MKRKFFMVGILLVSSPVSPHGLDKEVAQCASVIGKSARITCYDNLASKFDLAKQKTSHDELIEAGNWEVTEIVNPIDDTETVTIRLREMPSDNRWREPIDLVARCRNGRTELFISWNNFLGGEGNVLTRVGNEKAVGAHWRLSNDKRTTFHSRPMAFLKTISTSDKLVAQITPYNETPITAIFNTSGLESALGPIRDTCHW